MDNPEIDIQTIAHLLKERFGSQIRIKLNKQKMDIRNVSSLSNSTLALIYEQGLFYKRENRDFANRLNLNELYGEIENWLS